ncbi:phage holin family protein [Anaeromicropila populeti]|uniref:Toxin secretion/phage lysis holin n=1 Tax=Anaeromicropila populeti TaxID=37658 RepID=A0A1I6LRP4_9FIRM|nr:phage holin family protein [Anaeromicropila populeti]SFS06103.1 toxin secretion/phage lysis holin [Anaeromicropila populeti]
MKQGMNQIPYLFSMLGGILGWFFGGLDGFLYALTAFVVLDYISGLMAAGVEKKLSSKVGFRGICKKILIFCLVAVGHILDSRILQTGSVFRTAVIFFYLSNEGISLLENADRIGLPIPRKLKEILEQLRTDSQE